MALCRVYIRPDNSIAVIHPNPKLREVGESEADFLERICTKDAPLNDLHTLPFKDFEKDTLPDRAQRAQWEFRNGKPAIKGRPV